MDTKKTMNQVTLADWKVNKKQLDNVQKVLKSGRLTYGPFTKELEEKFGTRVRLTQRGDKGTLCIEFFSRDELKRILGILDV